ncbi:hypothetical protein BJP34_22625 [Moorena producens PAL-8-15-08-1]|uniref:Uncharacterized protein n=2 Tax=Moorena TaxID=1155738 RepID=A0A1D8TW38_9CYAN|nr:hypothetical protein BJP34_22625 [Moorena producens PAL-8-15-08-1]
MIVRGKVNRARIKTGDISTTKDSVYQENQTDMDIIEEVNDANLKTGTIDIRPDDMADMKAEIQQLLNKIADNPITAKESVAVEIIKVQINDNPTLKQRLICALKAGGIEGLKALFNHPAFSIPVETVKGFLDPE